MMDFQQGANLVFLLIPVHKQPGSCYFHREGMFGGRGIHIFIDEYDADYDDGGDDASQGSDEKPISVIIEWWIWKSHARNQTPDVNDDDIPRGPLLIFRPSQWVNAKAFTAISWAGGDVISWPVVWRLFKTKDKNRFQKNRL